MITLKDMALFKPSMSKIIIANHDDFDACDMIRNPDRYVVTDMRGKDKDIEILIKKMGECEIIKLNEEE